MDQFISNINSSGITMTQAVANVPFINIATPVLAIIIALVLGLFGYKLKRVAFFIIWFMLGYVLASKFAPQIFANEAWYVPIIVQILLGLLLGFVGYKVERLAIFGAAFYIAFSVLSSYFPQDSLIQVNGLLYLLIKIIISFIIGGVAVSASRPLIIILTSLYAGSLVYTYLPQLFTMPYTVALIISIVVIVFSIGFQFAHNND